MQKDETILKIVGARSTIEILESLDKHDGEKVLHHLKELVNLAKGKNE